MYAISVNGLTLAALSIASLLTLPSILQAVISVFYMLISFGNKWFTTPKQYFTILALTCLLVSSLNNFNALGISSFCAGVLTTIYIAKIHRLREVKNIRQIVYFVLPLLVFYVASAFYYLLESAGVPSYSTTKKYFEIIGNATDLNQTGFAYYLILTYVFLYKLYAKKRYLLFIIDCIFMANVLLSMKDALFVSAIVILTWRLSSFIRRNVFKIIASVILIWPLLLYSDTLTSLFQFEVINILSSDRIAIWATVNDIFNSCNLKDKLFGCYDLVVPSDTYLAIRYHDGLLSYHNAYLRVLLMMGVIPYLVLFFYILKVVGVERPSEPYSGVNLYLLLISIFWCTDGSIFIYYGYIYTVIIPLGLLKILDIKIHADKLRAQSINNRH
jgi:hypothetical protein